MDAIQTSALHKIADFVLSAPTLEQVIAFKASAPVQERLEDLLDRNKNNQLTIDEQEELDEFLRLDQFVQFLRARLKLAHK